MCRLLCLIITKGGISELRRVKLTAVLVSFTLSEELGCVVDRMVQDPRTAASEDFSLLSYSVQPIIKISRDKDILLGINFLFPHWLCVVYMNNDGTKTGFSAASPAADTQSSHCSSRIC